MRNAGIKASAIKGGFGAWMTAKYAVKEGREP